VMSLRGKTLGDSPGVLDQWSEKNTTLNCPEKIPAGSHKKFSWVCHECEHEWITSVKARCGLGQGCPFCFGRRGVIHSDGRNSMKNTHPQLAAEFHTTLNGTLTPDNTLANTRKKIVWVCSTCDHVWKNTGGHRVNRNQGCPVCEHGDLHSDQRNSMRNTHPHLAEDFHPTKNGTLTPDTIIAGTTTMLHWLCSTCSHEWETKGVWRKNGNGCNYCSPSPCLHSDGRNSLSNLFPEIAEDFHPTKNGTLTPDTIIAGTNTMLHWLCSTCSHEWSTSGANRVNRESGCPYCAGQALHTDGRNCLSNTHPLLASQMHPAKNGDLSPNSIVAGTNKKVFWICNDCGNEWKAVVSSRAAGRGCPKCAKTGFDPSEPAYYYVMEIVGPTERWWFKGGISSNPENRMGQIRRSLKRKKMPLTVELLSTQSFENGSDAHDLEQKLLACSHIRISTKERFDGSKELFSENPLDFALSKGWIQQVSD
jgi:Zn finger protein HypA/HybF involved in hydrogenase expression